MREHLDLWPRSGHPPNTARREPSTRRAHGSPGDEPPQGGTMRTVLRLLFCGLLASLAGRAGAEPAVPSGTLTGVVRTSDGLPLPGVAVVLEGPASVRRVTTGPDGSLPRHRASCRLLHACSSTRPAWSCATAGRSRSSATETRQDVVLAPAPVAERVVVSATRGEATLSTLGRERRRARPRARSTSARRRRCCRCCRTCPASPPPAAGRPASRARCSSAAASRATRA